MLVSYLSLAFFAVFFLYVVRKFREYQWGRGRLRNTTALTGKIFIITGANSGLGAAATLELAKRDATVILACRSAEGAKSAIANIRNQTDYGSLIFLELDLAYFQSIYAFTDKIKMLYPRFDTLINNAGVKIPMAGNRVTRENHEIHCGVNHLGHFLLTHLLRKTIQINNSRIVVMSSRLMGENAEIDFNDFGKYVEPQKGDPINKMYNNSKLMNFYHARELYTMGHDVHVVCPGLSHTELMRNYNMTWYKHVLYSPFFWLFMRSAKQGAQNIVHAATDALNTVDINPGNGYLICDVLHKKSGMTFNVEVSKRLWTESARLCGVDSII